MYGVVSFYLWFINNECSFLLLPLRFTKYLFFVLAEVPNTVQPMSIHKKRKGKTQIYKGPRKSE